MALINIIINIIDITIYAFLAWLFERLDCLVKVLNRKRDPTMKFVIRIVQLSVWTLLIGLCLPVVPADGQDATWRLNPVNQNWTTPLNWDPPTLPAGTAVFDQSTITSLTFPNTATVGTIQFNAGAPAYNFTLTGSN